MRILIIEDEPDKFRRISIFLLEKIRMAECFQARSLNAGLRKLEDGEYFDLLILDMSLPTFDVGHHLSPGGVPQTFGGQDIMDVLDAEGKPIPTILITAFERFFEGAKQVDLNAIDKEFSTKYDWYKGCVHYRTSSDAWQEKLISMLIKIFPSEMQS